MKKNVSKLLAVLMAVLIFGSACFQNLVNAKEKKQTDIQVTSQKKSTGSVKLSDEEIENRVKDMISKMTIEQKLTQMMIVSLRCDAENVHTTKLTNAYKKMLTKYDFGGMILFGKSILDTKQTITLIRECQAASMKSENGIPMFVCIDQEGGSVNRLSFGTIGSGNMSLAAAGDTSLTEETADILGQEISSLGFNMDFAPVSDVNNNPANPIIGHRSFSDDPQVVGENVIAFINGLKKNNISAALKHFPGHGNVGEDSHTHLPLSELTKKELKKCELIPFKEGIDAGADMIMTAHIQYPNIEKETYVSKLDGEKVYLPATLSHTIMTDILRKELGYDGIIITDAMDMDAIESHFDEIDAAVLAINAGVDILLCSVELYKDKDINTFDKAEEYIKNLADRVKNGDIKEEELDDSVARILKLKYKNGIMTDTLSVSKKKQIKSANKIIGSAEHHEKEWEIASKGVTLVKNDDGMLPINGKDGKNTLILIPSEYRRDTVVYSLERLEKEGLIDTSLVDVICYSEITIKNKALKKAMKKADRILVLSQSTAKSDLVCSIIEKAHQKKNCKVALLSLNLPYDVACYEDVDAAMCSYYAYGSAHDAEGNGPFNLNFAVSLCAAFGETVPTGKLPVNIPKVYVDDEGKITYSDELLYERGYSVGN